MIEPTTTDDPFASRAKGRERETPSILRTIPSSSIAMTELSATLQRIADSEALPAATRTLAREVLTGRTSLSHMLDDAVFGPREQPENEPTNDTRKDGIRWE